ncbi:hypothetical protein [Methylobacterium sp. ID0610]|uniref:hypothetical protein n=1 Tax=Methylobacterium carpenticola TaxID=3344827 RepID=UPI0036BF8AB7
MSEPVRITVKPDGSYTLLRGERPLIFGLTRELAFSLAESCGVAIERVYSIG